MTVSKLDRRKKYTRMVLKNSLMILLKEKHISAITVKEICELADINRSTFYSHFADHFELLDKIEDEIIEDMEGYLSQYQFDKDENDTRMIEKLLEYFASKHEECTTLLNEKIDTTFQNKVMVFAHHIFIKNWRTHYDDEEFFEYVSTFIISGATHTIKNWLNNGMNKSPKEMAELINTIIKRGIMGLE